MKTAAAISTALLCGLLWPAGGRAEGWEYRVTPYLWLPTMSTDMKIGSGPSASADASILDVLEFGFLATGEARKGDWGLLGEFNYLSLSQDASWGDHFDAEMKLKGVMGSAAVAYRVAKGAAGWLDAFGGARLWSMKTEVEFDRLPDASKTKSWVDPLLGLRGQYSLTDSLYVGALGDIGGFGVGSHLQWEIVGSIGYRVSDTISAEIGSRYMSLDLNDGALDLNAKLRGPFIAVNFAF